jgi:hypothetical protein
MTLPDERRNAVNNLRKVISDDLLPLYVKRRTSQKYIRVPVDTVGWLVRLLKHYPSEYEMNQAGKAAPQIFGDWQGKPLKGGR